MMFSVLKDFIPFSANAYILYVTVHKSL